MIVDLELEGWRAYDHVKVEFQPGTTFIVARNGVGKTSLLQGAAFALFGDRSGFALPASIRSGFAAATAKVSVALDEERVLSIERTLNAKKSPPAAATLNGAPVAAEEVEDLLGAVFGADPSTLARMTFLPAGSLLDYDSERLTLHQHLCKLFGVSQLQTVRDVDLKQLGTEARAAVRKSKDVKKSSTAEVQAWVAELERIDDELLDVSAQIASAQEQLAAAAAVIERRRLRTEFERRDAERASALNAIREQLTVLFDGAGDAGPDLAEGLETVDQTLNIRIAELERARGRLEGRIELLESSKHQLDHADAECPVCLRALDDTTREVAAAAHLINLAEHRSELETIESDLVNLGTQRRGVATLRSTLANLPALPERLDEVTDESLAAAEAGMPVAEARAAELIDRAAALRGRATVLRTKLDDDETLQREHEASVQAFRQEALVIAADSAVRMMVDALIEEKINPLAEQVTARWKTVFQGSRPVLTLDSTGELKLMRGEHLIAFPDMSAGERAVALLITRLLVLGVTAPTGFLWLDEPLEQLDPRNRRLIGQLLTASSSGAIRQLVVTTFEEEMARRLEQSAADVHVKYVTSGT